jgi:CO dehydrogenase maturation factor
MRVTFFGKGGSGKTTLASAFVKFLENKNKSVLAIDADINVNLASALNMPKKYLGDIFDDLCRDLEKDHTKPLIGSSPVSKDSIFIKGGLNDPFIKKFATFNEKGTALLTVGTYTDNKIGFDCYHSKLGSVIFIYNRLLDDENLFVVTDATAGIDSVGTSMFNVSDLNIFVVEPTKKSVTVYKEFKDIVSKHNINTYVVANKIKNDDDIAYIKQNIDEEFLLATINESDDLRKFEQGDDDGLERFIIQNNNIFEAIFNKLENTPKDWDKYYEIQKQIYTFDVGDWYSQFYGEDLTKYIDEDFSYKDVLKND